MHPTVVPPCQGAPARVVGACRGPAQPGLHAVNVAHPRASFRAILVAVLAGSTAAIMPAAEILGDFRLTTGAIPEDINDGGLIVGRDGSLGFVMRKGEITPFIAPPVQGRDFPFSQLYGVNNAGNMVGEYFALGVDPTGFVVQNGVLTTIAFPDPSAVRTIPHDINNRGHIAGFYQDTFNRNIGFLLRGSRFDSIDLPGTRFTTILGMNDHDHLVGHVVMQGDPDFLRHGILWKDGQVTPIAYPGATQTEPTGIRNDGTIVGTYTKVIAGANQRFAFILSNGVYSTIGVPGVFNNGASRINIHGVIVGDYFWLQFSNSGQLVGSGAAGWIRTPPPP